MEFIIRQITKDVGAIADTMVTNGAAGPEDSEYMVGFTSAV
jgi:hypothetical protein